MRWVVRIYIGCIVQVMKLGLLDVGERLDIVHIAISNARVLVTTPFSHSESLYLYLHPILMLAVSLSKVGLRLRQPL